MNATKYTLIFVMMYLLSGCSSAPPSIYVQECMRTTERMSSARWDCIQQANIKKQQDENRQVEQAQRNKQLAEIENLRIRCDAFGFKRNTTEHSQCMYNLQRQDIDNNFRAAQVNQENERIRQQSLRDFNEAIKPPAFLPLQCPSGMMRNGKCQ